VFAKVNALGKDLVAGHAQAGRERTEELVMKNQDFTTTISVDQSPEEAFEAITNVLAWSSGEIEGGTGMLGAGNLHKLIMAGKSQPDAFV